jgi:DNA repair protein RecO (recombination protein O)
MRVHSAEALILRTYRYGEADRIVVFLTDDRGKKRGVAKNATKSRRRFGAGLEPLTRGRVMYVEREGRELVRLDRIEPAVTPLAPTRGRPSDEAAHALGHASYFAELLDEWAPENAPNERLFRLGASVVEALGCGGSVEALARYFEYWLLRLEGVYPAFDELGLSSEAVTFLRDAGRLAPEAAAAEPPSSRALREIERVHHRLIAMHLEKELRSARVVKELRPQS